MTDLMMMSSAKKEKKIGRKSGEIEVNKTEINRQNRDSYVRWFIIIVLLAVNLPEVC